MAEHTTDCDAPSDAQRADHFQHMYEQASEGKCGASGLNLPVCKASICDCFDFPWVEPDEDAADRHFNPDRPRVGDLVRYVGTDPRWAGQQGPVTKADYARRVPLVVLLPGGPKGIGICFNEADVERVTTPAVTEEPTDG